MVFIHKTVTGEGRFLVLFLLLTFNFNNKYKSRNKLTKQKYYFMLYTNTLKVPGNALRVLGTVSATLK